MQPARGSDRAAWVLVVVQGRDPARGRLRLVVLAHSMQSLFYAGSSRSPGLEWNSFATLSNSSLRDMADLLRVLAPSAI